MALPSPSRHGTDLTHAFADLAKASRVLPECVLDGELVAVLDSGELSFTKLQSRSGQGPRPNEGFTVHLAAFDVLAVGGKWAVGDSPGPCNRRRLYGPGLGGRPRRSRGRGHETEPALRSRSRLGLVEVAADAQQRGCGPRGERPDPRNAVPRPRSAPKRRSDAGGGGQPSSRFGGTARVASAAPASRRYGGELPGTVGGLPSAEPVWYLPVVPEVVVEIEADQSGPHEFGRFRHRPRVLRVRGDIRVQDLDPGS